MKFYGQDCQMISRRFFSLFLLPILWLFVACDSTDNSTLRTLVIGVVSYGEGARSLEQFADLKDHLGKELKTLVELEPALNEIQAVEQIDRQNWDLVFAPPGLAAIAISQSQYVAILPREAREQETSVIVVKSASPLQNIKDLANKPVALGQRGSATGYYFPVYNLYGLTLAEVQFAATPKEILQWIQEDKVVAGALSLAELEQYQNDFAGTEFRVLAQDSHPVPSGAILLKPSLVNTPQKDKILEALDQASPQTKEAVGYIANVQPPNYDYMIQVVKRVQPIAERIKDKPAPLY